MIRWRRCPIILMAVISVAAMPSVTGERSVAVPGVPPIVIPTIPGSETARFKVLVEGTATAALDHDAGNTAGDSPCLVTVHSVLRETTTFQRGKGVVLEFTRLGKGPGAPIIVRRPGRSLSDTSLVLKTTTTRTAEGTASRSSSTSPPVCPPLSEDFTKGPDCGKPQLDTARAALLYTRPSRGLGLLRLRLRVLGALGAIDCPVSEIDPGVDALKFAWPGSVMSDGMRVPLPPGVIFGTKRVIVETFDSGLISTGAITSVVGGLTITETNFGRTTLTIRLIRVP